MSQYVCIYYVHDVTVTCHAKIFGVHIRIPVVVRIIIPVHVKAALNDLHVF